LTAKTGEGESVYIKDLSILKNCSIKKIIIVDDNPISYILNPENGVPIIPFEGQTPDNHLLHLFHTLN
jgi:TFIIF-interacting CTD phosphatase-like protein